jgi:outer membrane biosynthesis protein TonB
VLRLIVILLLFSLSPACRFFGTRKRAPVPPVITQPGPQVTPAPPPVVVEPPNPVPPKPETPKVEPPKPEPPPPETVKRPSPFPAPSTPPTKPSPPPQLTQILTAQQQQEYNRGIDQSITRARRALASVIARNLTPEQRATADRVRTFLAQAEEARRQDLIRAKGLADRADLLAQDLVKSVR